jgi:cytochrome c peroxidase
MGRPKLPGFASAVALSFGVLLIVAGVQAQSEKFFPNGTLFSNPNGTSSTYNTKGNGIHENGAFFQTLGTNGRSCATCHQPGDGMTVSAASVQQRFDATDGLDPIFRTVDGANCPTNDVSSVAARSNAYSLVRTRGLIRIGLDVPANADFVVTDVDNQYGCDSTSNVSTYRRPLPSTNLRFLSAIMWDGRESAGARKITFDNYSEQLIANLLTQSLDATNGHAEGAGLHPTTGQKKQIVDFEMGLFTAQATGTHTGWLNGNGATGGPGTLVTQPFFISINSSLGPSVEPPSGRNTPGDGQPFTSTIFDLFDAWAGLPSSDPRAAVARGQTLFNTTPIVITGVGGLNDDFNVPSLQGTCGTCHDTPNVGNHSFPTPLNIGTGDLMGDNPIATANKGNLDIGYMPKITVCKKDTNGDPSSTCVTTTDLGQALIDGKFHHVGKIKGPILRGLSARAPYFHNGSAKTLRDVVNFYQTRFNMNLTESDKDDLVAFLSSL